MFCKDYVGAQALLHAFAATIINLSTRKAHDNNPDHKKHLLMQYPRQPDTTILFVFLIKLLPIYRSNRISIVHCDYKCTKEQTKISMNVPRAPLSLQSGACLNINFTNFFVRIIARYLPPTGYLLVLIASPVVATSF